MPAPYDDDITTPSRPRPARPVPAPPVRGPAAAPPPPPLAWGMVGSLHRVEPLTVLPGQTGVVRLLPNTLRYTRPPLELTWSEVKTEPGRFEMVWPGDPTAARSLADIGSDLRRLHRTQSEIPADHPLCRELDEAVFALLAAGEQLHRQGWDVGLLSPKGVLLNRGDAGLEAVLVDLGFTWTGEFGDPPWEHSPGRPDWLDPDPAANPGAAAWERPPVEQQFAAPSGSPFPPPAPGSNVRTLARVIGWTLTGDPANEYPAGPANDVWSVLRSALDGSLNTPGDLAVGLQSAPPSTHFASEPISLTEPGAGGRRTSRWVWLPIVAAGVLALLVSAVLLGPFFNSEPTGTTRGTPGDGRQLRDEYEKLPADDLDGRLDKFKDLAAAVANDPDLASYVGEARQKLFADWISACEVQVAGSADAARRGEAGDRLRKLTDKYRAIHTEHPPPDPAHREKEQQWLDEYDRQAEYLGWPR